MLRQKTLKAGIPNLSQLWIPLLSDKYHQKLLWITGDPSWSCQMFANLVKLSVERLSTERSCFLCGKAEGDTTVPLRNPFNLCSQLPQELPGKCLAEPLLPTTKPTNPSQHSAASLSHKICNSKATNHRCKNCSYTRALDKILKAIIYNTSCVSCCLSVRGCHPALLHTLGAEWDIWLPCKCCNQFSSFLHVSNCQVLGTKDDDNNRLTLLFWAHSKELSQHGLCNIL